MIKTTHNFFSTKFRVIPVKL